ncbi:hypothetical protein AMTRI_Chr12g271290 [Amborella trichopoda]
MKDQSGFGWNEESHMAIIDNSLWDDYVMLMHIILILQSNPFAKNFKGKSFEYWKELSIIVDNDFANERDIDDDVEDIRETIVGLDDDDGVEEIGDDENFRDTNPIKDEWNEHQSI